jgi:enamine deaminase RidA (YjgF/YER057c/UK114 family)
MAGNRGRRSLPVAFFALLLLVAGPSRGEEERLAISGYDPVAYFTESKPTPGRSEFEHRWHNARWRFASAANRDSFAGNPDRYAPQYDGYCAGGVGGAPFAGPHKDTVDPEVWTIVDGKLYLAHFGGPLWDEWRENAAENIKSADASWKFVKDQADPVIVGPPCRGRPPAVIITTNDGKRELMIGSQVALDNDGNIVGKGDMRAQIEQVGKNIDACLKAAGASNSNIIWSETSVANKEMFLKYADVWANYLGPKQPPGAAVEKPQLAGPDFLVEIRAVALFN